MATYDLDRTQLGSLLTPNIDAGARAAVIDYLLNHGDLHDGVTSLGEDDDGPQHGHHLGHDNDSGWHHGFSDSAIKVEISDGSLALDPKAQLLDLTSATNTVTTDAALKVIVENVASDASLTVHGSSDVLIAMGGGNDHVWLEDTGHDVVLAGSGSDSIQGGEGADSIFGGSGSDLLQAGSGDHQLLVGGSGDDTIIGGDGSHDSLYGGSGNDVLHAGNGDHQFLMGGSGDDTLFGGDGSHDTLVGGSGNDVIHAGNGDHQLVIGGGGSDTIYAGSGGDTLVGGHGHDVFVVDNHNGDDTIEGGSSGHDVVQFDNRASTDIASLHTSQGETVIHFTDGQTVTVSHIQELVFTDTTHHL